MILLLDSDPERMVTVASGLTETGQPVLGVDRAETAAQLMDRAGCALVILTDMVAGWRRFLGDNDAPVLLLTDNPSSQEAGGADAAMGAGIATGAVLQMARALLTGEGEMRILPAPTPAMKDVTPAGTATGQGALDGQSAAALDGDPIFDEMTPFEFGADEFALPADTPTISGVMTNPELPDPGEGEEGPVSAWRSLDRVADILIDREAGAEREIARREAQEAAEFAERVARERREAIAADRAAREAHEAEEAARLAAEEQAREEQAREAAAQEWAAQRAAEQQAAEQQAAEQQAAELQAAELQAAEFAAAAAEQEAASFAAQANGMPAEPIHYAPVAAPDGTPPMPTMPQEAMPAAASADPYQTEHAAEEIPAAAHYAPTEQAPRHLPQAHTPQDPGRSRIAASARKAAMEAFSAALSASAERQKIARQGGGHGAGQPANPAAAAGGAQQPMPRVRQATPARQQEAHPDHMANPVAATNQAAAMAPAATSAPIPSAPAAQPQTAQPQTAQFQRARAAMAKQQPAQPRAASHSVPARATPATRTPQSAAPVAKPAARSTAAPTPQPVQPRPAMLADFGPENIVPVAREPRSEIHPVRRKTKVTETR